MSWIHKLYETYENCQSMIGVSSDENQETLLPICHTTSKAQIEITIDQDGNFKRARVVPEDKARTIVPCTESSGGRTSGEAPHPLCDKLQYVAADYKKYGGGKAHYFSSYQDLLRKWCESEYSHTKAKAVLKYIEKENVIKDLIEYQVLFIGTDNKLTEKWDKKIIKDASKSQQDDAFVRWIIENTNDPQTLVWTDSSLFQSWINYYLSTKEKSILCYVIGEENSVAEQHPRNIRRDGDGAKLISSGKTKDQNGKEKVNDTTGFTFLGRFSDASQACSISLDVSQKAHLVLRWLIGRQGKVFYEGKPKKPGLTIVAWATSGKDIPDPLADPTTILGFNEMQSDSEPSASTAQELALKLKKKIVGYSADLGDKTDIVVMGLDSATRGRMAISFYQELTGSDFLNRVEEWHRTCSWIHDYGQKEIVDSKTGKENKVHFRFVGAPAPSDIARAAYGHRVDDTLRKKTVERLLPCIIDGQKIPLDLVNSAVTKASNRVSMEGWEWNKTLSIACALYRKYHEKENYDMALEENRKTRDYLYGRLLALADNLEQWALNEAGEKRRTNATRLMQRFADHPFTTWKTIELSLEPSKARLGFKSIEMQQLISQVVAMFEPDDFLNDKKLNGEFLLGYHCQREDIKNRIIEKQKSKLKQNNEKNSLSDTN